MNYTKIYNNLIDTLKNRIPTEGIYYERHHIVPKCLGGNNSKENLILLSAREHYIAHQLLCKIYPTHQGLAFACRSMTTGTNGNRITNREYEWIKTHHSKRMIEKYANKSNHPMYGKKHTLETKNKLRSKALGRTHSEESKEKIKRGVRLNHIKFIGIPLSEERKHKISIANTGKKRSDEDRKKRSEHYSGSGNPNYGKRKFPLFVYEFAYQLQQTGYSYKKISKYLKIMDQNIPVSSLPKMIKTFTVGNVNE
jgi:hypothetical protein